MRRRVFMAVAGVLVLALLVLFQGFKKVPQWHLTSSHQGGWNIPFQGTSLDFHTAVGIDGRLYGPLAFDVFGHHLYVADTYQSRVVVMNPHVQIIPVDQMMIEDMVVGIHGNILLADNQSTTIWRYGSGKPHLLIQFPHIKGYTEAIWHLSVTPQGKIIVEIVRFGRGTFSIWVNEYTRLGKFIRHIAVAEGSRSRLLTPLSNSPIPEVVRSFQVSPSGDIYIESPPTNTSFRQISIYRNNGRLVSHLKIQGSEPIYNSHFLGVNKKGFLYLGVNLTIAHKAQVLMVTPQGNTISDIHVHALPIHTAIYGRVASNGTLYLDQSTMTHYRIDVWQLQKDEVWRWKG